jgi:hypothetical protein
MWCMQLNQHTTSCGSGNSLFTGGDVEDILLAFLPGGPGVCVSLSLPRPSFIVLNIYAPPQHLVLTTMLREIVKGPAPSHRTGFMQDTGQLPRTHILGTPVNKPP